MCTGARAWVRGHVARGTWSGGFRWIREVQPARHVSSYCEARLRSRRSMSRLLQVVLCTWCWKPSQNTCTVLKMGSTRTPQRAAEKIYQLFAEGVALSRTKQYLVLGPCAGTKAGPAHQWACAVLTHVEGVAVQPSAVAVRHGLGGKALLGREQFQPQARVVGCARVWTFVWQARVLATGHGVWRSDVGKCAMSGGKPQARKCGATVVRRRLVASVGKLSCHVCTCRARVAGGHCCARAAPGPAQRHRQQGSAWCSAHCQAAVRKHPPVGQPGRGPTPALTTTHCRL